MKKLSKKAVIVKKLLSNLKSLTTVIEVGEKELAAERKLTDALGLKLLILKHEMADLKKLMD